ncbi:acyltransferase family protein [Paenibacillus sp. VCA1]|uniref:acyltransferase family protein n=1 Tax=Paenibacillus sp. VCA1 TaxID=3039148 RepID=UPI002870C245|nr:acyltransferase family protein [Paenibacillus sp. VCA1]MDR9854874.1 acyltransferase family protein [Paenibacillus sp. VCA1]
MSDNMKLYSNRHSRRLLPQKLPGDKRYMPGLDGLRAFSVMAVIAYHMNAKWAQGGLIGVGIFFVISGYLITDQMIQEWQRHRRLNLMDFWIRRVRRLLPAMLAMLGFVALWLLCVDPGRLQDLKGAFLSSLFYMNNWWLIYHKVSYFESFGPPSPIGHLWSLSIEEQFYLIWPLLFMIGLHIIPRRGKLTLAMLALAAVSALAMAVLYVPGTDPSRVYYGTDTRAFALLIGAALAVIWPSRKLGGRISAGTRSVLDIAGFLGLAVLIMLVYRVNEYDDYLYRGGFLLISLLSAAVIAALAHPASRIGKAMGCKFLRWIGVRSYSLYLWHYPVIIFTTPEVQTEGSGMLRILFQLSLSFILAACSYKYIEEPLRRGGLFMKRNQPAFAGKRRLRPIFLGAMFPAVFIAAVCGHVFFQKTEPAAEVVQAEGMLTAPHPDEHETSHDKTNEKADNKEDVPPKQHETDDKETAMATAPSRKPASGLKPPSGQGITAIGDSVMLDAAPFLEQMLPGIVVDGKVGRQMRQAEDVIERLEAEGHLGDRIIIELGTNGPFNKKQLRSLLQSLGKDKQIILVNTRVPRNWQDTVNRDIEEVSSEFGNAAVVDWYSASEGKDDYFYRDGVHLKRSGAEYYASMLVKAVTASGK